MPEHSGGEKPAIVLVTGSGRSGTSSLAGSLKRLGLHIPQPEVPAKPSNPRGFYEPQWVIAFHKRHLQPLALHNIDSRPEATSMVADLLSDGKVEAELRAWLALQLEHPLIVIKDPHAYWFAAAWRSAAADLGVDLRLLTALRHPAEVMGSRDLAYLQKQPDELRLVKETSNVAGWVHSALLTEHAGRGLRRAFLRYSDLITDWRTALGLVGAQLGLTLDTDLTSERASAVDVFLDSGLRNSQLSWDDITVPAQLHDMAEEVWQLLAKMVDHPDDPASIKRMDEIHADYDEMYRNAVAMVYDHTHGQTALALREAESLVEKLRTQLRQERTTVARLGSREAEPSSRIQPPRRLARFLRNR